MTNAKLSLIYLNTRSLPKNINLIEKLMQLLAHRPNITAVSETTLNNNNNCNTVTLDDTFFHVDSNTKAGSVGLYVLKKIICSSKPDLVVQSAGTESLFVELSMGKLTQKLIIGVVYRHPNSCLKEFEGAFCQTTKN